MSHSGPTSEGSTDYAPLDVSDLVRDSIDRASEHAARAAAAAAPAPAAVHEDQTLPHAFCLKLQRLLNVLNMTFPERTKLATWKAIFEASMLGNAEMEEYVIKKWHYDMTHTSDGTRRDTDLYQLTKLTDESKETKAVKIEELLSSGLWVFEEIDARAMYFDEDLDDYDRDMICTHFNAINSHAKLYATLPSDMREVIRECTTGLDPTQPITPATTQAIMQKVIGCDPSELGDHPEAVERLINWSTQLCSSFADGSGLEALQTIVGDNNLAQATGVDVAGLMAALQGEVGAGAEMAGSNVDPLDRDEDAALSSVLGSLDLHP